MYNIPMNGRQHTVPTLNSEQPFLFTKKDQVQSTPQMNKFDLHYERFEYILSKKWNAFGYKY